MINAVNEFLDDLRGGRMTDAPVVTVAEGQLQGRVANTPSGKAYYAFQGVPYAQPPLGELRFKAPKPSEPWEGIRDATSEGNVSAQIDPIFSKTYVGDENCLYLNVYTPNIDGAFLPVMVYIHGGGFKYGSGNTDMYGPDFLVEKDVVIVTINYRLGVLGFLSLNTPEVPGNAGIKDVIQALKWVKENIENFGGNAGNLTVFGESSGGCASSLVTASPLSKNLISRAIVQSGTALFNWSYQKNPVENARNLAKILGCEAESVDEILEFLRATSVKDIVEAHEKMNSIDGLEDGPNSFVLVVEKEFPGVESVITEPFIDLLTSGRVAHVPIMIGSTSLEFAFERKSDDLQSFIPEELNIDRNSEEALEIAEQIKCLYFKGNHTGVESLHEYYQLLSDKYINIDTHRYVQYLVQSTNVPIYYYKFDYVGELNVSSKTLHTLGLKRAMHLDDLGYLFKNEFQKDVEPTPQDIKMRERMVRLWTNFAKTGNPTPDETHYLTVTWQPVTKDNLYYLNLGTEMSIATNPDKEKMDFWDKLYNKHFKIWDQTTNKSQVTEVTQMTQVIVTSETFENLVEIDKETGVCEATDLNDAPQIVDDAPKIVTDADTIDLVEIDKETGVCELTDVNDAPQIVDDAVDIVDDAPKIVDDAVDIVDDAPKIVDSPVLVDAPQLVDIPQNDNQIAKTEHMNGNGVEKPKPRTSNEIKMVSSNGAAKDVIRANDPPEDDLPKNIGVNKFVNFFESLGGKK